MHAWNRHTARRWQRPFALIALVTTLAAPSAFAQKSAPKEEQAKEAKAKPLVFVAKLQAGPGTSDGEASLLNDALLVAIKRFDDKFEIRTTQDIEGIAKLEEAQTLAGCDVVSCAAEIGDALGAEQLVTGQLGRVGTTWILSLTRTERSTLRALARTQVRAQGEAPDILFPLIEQQAAETFGQAPASAPGDVEPVDAGGGPSLLFLAGGGAAIGVGAVAGALAAVTYYLSFQRFNDAKTAVTPSDFDGAIQASQNAYWATVALGITSAILVSAGGVAAGAAFVAGE